MKKNFLEKMIGLLIAGFIVLGINACTKNNTDELSNGMIKMIPNGIETIEGLKSSVSDDEVPYCCDCEPQYIYYQLTDTVGNIIKDDTIYINDNTVRLQAGFYKLEKFKLLNIYYKAQLGGMHQNNRYAQLFGLTDTLGVVFEIKPFKYTKVNIDVLCIRKFSYYK